MALHFSFKNWTFISIDPLLRRQPYQDVGAHHIIQYAGKSQDYEIETTKEDEVEEDDKEEASSLDIVVCCHSHAPLQEFWNRLTKKVVVVSPTTKRRRLAIVMPCCADFSHLIGITPLRTFDDYEVYSPKRTIHIYCHQQSEKEEDEEEEEEEEK